MPFVSVGNLKYFRFDSFPEGVFQGVFTRLGGVSPFPWASLNLGGLIGDERDHVVENRRRIFEAIGRPVTSIYDVWQVHSADIINTEFSRPLDDPHIKADGIITQKKDVTLLMRFADCVPILLYDPVKRVVGIVHAGWQGTVKKVAGAAIKSMVSHYGSNPGDIIAGIGPSIGPDHYEVGQDVIDQVNSSFSSRSKDLLIPYGDRIHLNLWLANQFVLEEVGVKQIEQASICTACHTEDWFSHRKEKGNTGRFCAIIHLKNN